MAFPSPGGYTLILFLISCGPQLTEYDRFCLASWLYTVDWKTLLSHKLKFPFFISISQAHCPSLPDGQCLEIHFYISSLLLFQEGRIIRSVTPILGKIQSLDCRVPPSFSSLALTDANWGLPAGEKLQNRKLLSAICRCHSSFCSFLVILQSF